MSNIPSTDEGSLCALLLRQDVPWERIRSSYADGGLCAAVKTLKEFAVDVKLSTLVVAVRSIEDGLVDYTLPLWESEVLCTQVHAAMLIMARESLRDALGSLASAVRVNLRGFDGIRRLAVQTERLLFRVCGELAQTNEKLDLDPRSAWDGVDDHEYKDPGVA